MGGGLAIVWLRQNSSGKVGGEPRRLTKRNFKRTKEGKSGYVELSGVMYPLLCVITGFAS